MEKELNRILHQPIRTKIMAYLVAHGSCDYTALKKEFDLSDGHMTTHMRELLEHQYISMKKTFVDNKPCTTYILTSAGKISFAQYIQSLKKIIMFDE